MSQLSTGSQALETSQVSDKMHLPGQSKTDLKKKIYKEFSTQKKKKITLTTMDDAAKEKYLANQVATLEKLRAHKLNLREHLDMLEDKLDDTLIKMKEKKKAENKDTQEEKKTKGRDGREVQGDQETSAGSEQAQGGLYRWQWLR
jgi:hypothetical protein